MTPTRRDFLRLGGSTLLACGTAVPSFLARSALALDGAPGRPRGRVLVVLQLDGGNDGLNTVVPFRDDAYRRARPRLALPVGQVLRLNDDLGLHPSLAGLKRLYDDRRLAVVQAVGYPNPNRSHFESMAIWHTARPDPVRETPGWLAGCLDRRFAAAGPDSPALNVGGPSLPQALTGGGRHVPSLSSPEQLRRRLGLSEADGAAAQRAALDAVSGRRSGAPGSLLQFVERTAVVTYASSARLEAVLRDERASGGYPEFFGLARRLRLIAQLIKSGMGTSLYYTALGGFDTHSGQLGTHAGLLREVGDSLRAFLDDLDRSGDGGRVLVLVFSEFGRRLRENGSGGTDHGTAAPVLLAGRPVRPGLHGPNPNLTDLHDGDPRFAIDFRRAYAAVLDRWLGCPADAVLGGHFEPLPVIGAGRG
jgi:uncharacterized protein (DUF1501 family)